MTWNPLKRNHLTQKPTYAQPLLSIKEDRELEIAVQRLINVEETIRKMTKEMKKYLEGISYLGRADQNLTTNLSKCGLVHISDEFRIIVENYHSVTTQVDKIVQETSSTCEKTFIAPLKKLREEFILIASALEKRETLVNSWKLSYNRLKKLQEKKDRLASHIAKLERERKNEESLGKELKLVHAQLITNLPIFLEKRLEYIKPCVDALIAIQLDYYGNTTQLFTSLMPSVNACDSSFNSSITDEEYQRVMNNHFSRMKSLTIVKTN